MVPEAYDVLTPEYIDQVRDSLPDSDGEPMESPWHRSEIGLLIESYYWLKRDRLDYFVGGNMFIYYCTEQTSMEKGLYKGPDFFLVNNVDGTKKRRFWWVFDEYNRYPDCIVELLSPSTAKEDRTTKKEFYQQVFRTPEYFHYDPLTKQLVGWRLRNNVYHKIKPNKKGWLWSEQAELWLGTWEGNYLGCDDTWLRFYDADENLVLTQAEELAAENVRLKALLEAKGIKSPKNGRKSD